MNMIGAIFKDLEKKEKVNNCLKQRVRAILILPNGRMYYGANNINADIQECQRDGMKSGEGYHICKSVCKQNGHAEAEAIQNAMNDKQKIENSMMFLLGHTYCCDDCLRLLHSKKVCTISVLDSNIVYEYGELCYIKINN
jgi:deoxycytidylate deaminase